MQLQWWWDSTFEGLMTHVGKWLKEQGNIQIVSMDWKYEAAPSGAWYAVVVYKPAII